MLNELLVDVPSGHKGDANGDGTRDAFEDEFVELVNVAEGTLKLRGVQIVVGEEVAFSFEKGCLSPGSAVVVYGGYRGSGAPDMPAGASARVAPSRLALSNGGGTMRLQGEGGSRLDRVQWGEAPAESLTLDPQLRGSTYRPHSTLSEKRMTPGRCADGRPIDSGCPSTPTKNPDTGLDTGGG